MKNQTDRILMLFNIKILFLIIVLGIMLNLIKENKMITEQVTNSEYENEFQKIDRENENIINKINLKYD